MDKNYEHYLLSLSNKKLLSEYKNLWEAVCMSEEFTEDNRMCAQAEREMGRRGLRLNYSHLTLAV